MTYAYVGNRLKALRTERDLDQAHIADVLGLASHQIVSNIETGERKVKAAELVALADHFGVDVEFFTDPYRLVGEGRFSWRQNGCTEQQLRSYERTAGSWLAMFRHEAPR